MDEVKITYASNFESSLFLDEQNIVLMSPLNINVYPMETVSIDTGVSLYFTNKYSGILTNTTPQANNRIILPMSGLIYRGVHKNIKILLTNFNSDVYQVKKGVSQIANIQLIQGISLNTKIRLEKTND